MDNLRGGLSSAREDVGAYWRALMGARECELLGSPLQGGNRGVKVVSAREGEAIGTGLSVGAAWQAAGGREGRLATFCVLGGRESVGGWYQDGRMGSWGRDWGIKFFGKPQTSRGRWWSRSESRWRATRKVNHLFRCFRPEIWGGVTSRPRGWEFGRGLGGEAASRVPRGRGGTGSASRDVERR